MSGLDDISGNGKPQAEWRKWLDPSHPVLNNIEHEDIVQHSDKLLEKNAGLAQALQGLQRSLDEPYRGITTDGNLFPHDTNRSHLADVCKQAMCAMVCSERVMITSQSKQLPRLRITF